MKSTALLSTALIGSALLLSPAMADNHDKKDDAAKAAAEHPEPTQPRDLSAVPEGRYVLDKTHAALLFSVSHLGFADYHGRFDDFDGWMVFNPRKPEDSEVKIVVDLASVNTNSDKLEKKMLGKDWFHVDETPKATFFSSEIEKTGDYTGKIHGELEFLGQKQPLTLDVEWQGGAKNPFSQKYTLGFHATGTMKRADWGMGVYLPNIGNEVDLNISVEFQIDEEGDAQNYYGEL